MAANRLIISRGALLAVAVIFLVVAGRQIAAQTEGD